MEVDVQELRELVRLNRPKQQGDRYPDEVREAVIAWAQEQRKEGVPWSEIGGALGLAPVTAWGWVRKREKRHKRARVTEAEKGGFLAVQEVEATVMPRVSKELVLHLPGGARVTGLGVEDIATILRRL